MFLVAFFGCTAIIAFLHIVSFSPPKHASYYYWM